MQKGENETGDTSIRVLRPGDVDQAYSLETEGYPADEAATYEQLVYRQQQAAQLFLGYFEGTILCGYVCCTRYPGPHFSEESMKVHHPGAESVCIHSVCVAKNKRRQGIALKLLASLLQSMKQTQPGATRSLLLCKEQLIPLYTRAGFTLVGKSSVTHGKDEWHEMAQDV